MKETGTQEKEDPRLGKRQRKEMEKILEKTSEDDEVKGTIGGTDITLKMITFFLPMRHWRKKAEA